MGLLADPSARPAPRTILDRPRLWGFLVVGVLGFVVISLPSLTPARTTFLQELAAVSARTVSSVGVAANGTVEHPGVADRAASSPHSDAPGGDAGKQVGLLIPMRPSSGPVQPAPPAAVESAQPSPSVPPPPIPAPSAGPTLRPFSDPSSPEARLYTPEGQSHLAASALDPSGLAPFTQEFQAILWASQHPTDCSKRDYVVFGGWNGGLGSDVHVSGSMLLCAWRLGRVFIWSDIMGEQFTNDEAAPAPPGDGKWKSEVPQGYEAGAAPCPPGPAGFACLFQRPTNCTMDDVRKRTGDANARGSWSNDVRRHLHFVSPIAQYPIIPLGFRRAFPPEPPRAARSPFVLSRCPPPPPLCSTAEAPTPTTPQSSSPTG